jgi:phosphohistidine phosphatase SixA
MDHGRWRCPIESDPALMGDVAQLLARLASEPSSTKKLLIVGHEPTLSALVSALIGGGRIALPTAALAQVDLPIEGWPELSSATGELMWLVVPRIVRRLARGQHEPDLGDSPQ